ncbi:MAG: hypothetical protein SOX64_05670 [Treponema sp.]|nr:hypothetical protein [Treponema sp.]
MKKIIFLLAVFSIYFLSSCKPRNEQIVFQENDVINLNPSISWAVVTEPYAAFRKEASWDSSALDHCKLGDVLMIEGCVILNKKNDLSVKEIWYRFDKGWLVESSVSVYQNKLKAQKAAASLLK